jgi:hypothetical protein
MRATGFFFEHGTQVYLVTARHNLLPTNSDDLATGNRQLAYQTRDFLPRVDIYLRDGAIFTVERIDLREREGVLVSSDIDVIGIPIDINPEAYGYVTWRLPDIAPSDATFTTLDVIGYPNQAFPDGGEYNTDTYAEDITGPYVLNLMGDFQTGGETPSQTGLLNTAIDLGQNQHDTAYKGYSGSPILGDGLVGIHWANHSVTAVNTNTNEQTEHTAIDYWRADTLKQLFNREDDS